MYEFIICDSYMQNTPTSSMVVFHIEDICHSCIDWPAFNVVSIALGELHHGLAPPYISISNTLPLTTTDTICIVIAFYSCKNKYQL